MRWAATFVLGVLTVASTAGCQAGTAAGPGVAAITPVGASNSASQSGPTTATAVAAPATVMPSPAAAVDVAAVVPWRALPARPEPTVAVPPVVRHPDCPPGAFTLVSVNGGAWGGHDLLTVVLHNHADTCAMPTLTAATGLTAGGTMRRLRLGATPRAAARSPDSVAHAEAPVQLVFTISRCADVHNAPVPAPAKDQVTDVHLELSNRQTVPLGSSLNDGCGVTASWQSLPLRDEQVGPVIALFPGWGNLRVTSQLPNAFHRGQTLHFTITLKDVADTPFRLSPCPNYTIGIGSFADTGKTAHVLHAGLNCAAAPPAIPAHDAVAFAMTYQVPTDIPPGVAGFHWSLDQTNAGVNSANPTTGDALVS